MNIILISSLLGGAAFVLQVASFEEDKISVSVWPPGSTVYVGECVQLQCRVEASSSFVWTYKWFRNPINRAAIPKPRHLISNDTYSINMVTREDVGMYHCQATRGQTNTSSLTVISQRVTLSVSEQTPPSLTLSPNSRQFFRGERLTVQCPVSKRNSVSWILRRFSPGLPVRNFSTGQISPQGGAANSGLYWCESADGRSSAVHITVSSGDVILRTPALPVFVGSKVDLYCQYSAGNHNETTFFKNGAEVANVSSPDKVIKMTIENVTQEDEGLYKCAPRHGVTESPGSWLPVIQRGNITSTDETEAPSGPWKWVGGLCGLVLLLLILLSVWLVHRNRYKMFCTRSCWPTSKEDLPAVALPATKQDATEVQWDLPWMEMTNLLDKQSYPGITIT